MTRIAEILKAAYEEATGDKVLRLWWEPLGRGAEMQGPSGGWMVEAIEHGEDALGIDALMAIESIVLTAKLRAYDEYDAAWRRNYGSPRAKKR